MSYGEMVFQIDRHAEDLRDGTIGPAGPSSQAIIQTILRHKIPTTTAAEATELDNGRGQARVG